MNGDGTTISDSLLLPCGVVLRNRLVKAAMTEGLADRRNCATSEHQTLYSQWSGSGAGLLLTGNIQVDRRYMERPGNIAIDGRQSAEALLALENLAAAGSANGTAIWAQLSHAGRQTPEIISRESVGPSDLASGLSDYFGKPRALEDEEIQDIVARFVYAAKVTQECGFGGVQIHAAHGYLINQFLSPDVNNRTDKWGGSLKNRARLLLETVRGVRAEVGIQHPVSVKLNVADFHKGGFDIDDALKITGWLANEGVDLIELSGGTAEEPSMFLSNREHMNQERSVHIQQSDIAREAYFLDYARKVRAVIATPLMVTGGFRSRSGMNAALASGVTSLVGIGRPMTMDMQAPQKLLSGEIEQLDCWELQLKLTPEESTPELTSEMLAFINKLGPGLWFQYQVMQIGKGFAPDESLGLLEGMTGLQENDIRAAGELLWSE